VKKTLLKVLVVAVALIPMQVSAAELTRDSLDKLMVLSGITKQIAEIPGMVWTGFNQARKQGSLVGDAEAEEVKSTILKAFQSAYIVGAIGAEIKKSVTETDAEEMLGWYESDLGRKITKAEEQASTPAGYEEMLRNARSLLADQQRVGYAREIDSLTNVTEMMMQLQEHTGVAVFTALGKPRNPDFPAQLAIFRAQLASQEPQMRQDAQRQEHT
jgi:hypothetical protein